MWKPLFPPVRHFAEIMASSLVGIVLLITAVWADKQWWRTMAALDRRQWILSYPLIRLSTMRSPSACTRIFSLISEDISFSRSSTRWMIARQRFDIDEVERERNFSSFAEADLENSFEYRLKILNISLDNSRRNSIQISRGDFIFCIPLHDTYTYLVQYIQ